MKKRLLPITILAALGLAALAGCGGNSGGGGGGGDPVAVTGVTLNKENTTILKGGTETLVATVAPADAANKDVTWKSNKTSVATVADGVVSAVSMGDAVITVTTADGGFTATCNVVVSVAVSSFSITNKAAYEGMKEGENKAISFSAATSAGALNPEQVRKYVSVSSSDTTIATVTGTTIYAKKAGTTTITASLWGASDSFVLTVEEVPVVVVNYGTAEEPLTISDALTEVAKLELADKAYSAQPFFVKGLIKASLTPASQSGYVFALKEQVEESPKEMDVSSCLLEEGKTVDDYAIGDIVTITGYIRHQSGQHPNDYYISYNNGGESGKEAPKIIAWQQGQGGEKVPEPDVVEKTLAEFIALENKKDKAYFVTAKIKAFSSGATKDKFGNMTLTDDTNDLLVYGSTVTATALVWNDADAYSFSNPQDFLTNEVTSALNLGDTVKMKLIRDDYNTTIEGKGIIVDVTPGGGGEEVPEPAVVEKTLAEFIALPDSKALAYYVTAEVKSFKGTSTTHDQYGNLTLTDGANDLVIYGSSATESALAWNKVDAYAFQNPQDFLTNDVTKDIKIGDTVKMKLIRADFKGTVQGTGLVVQVTPCVIELTGIIVSGSSSVNLFGKTVDQTVQLTAAPDPAGAELGNVTWACQDTSGNPASVDQNSGLVTIPVDYVALDGDSKSFTVTATNGEKTSEPFTITVINEDDSGGGGEQQTYVVDFTAKTANHASYGDTWTYGDVTVSGGANNNGQWAFVKMGGKSATISGQSYPGTYIKTNNAINFAVSTVTLDLLGKSYNQETEKAVVKVESYSDAALTSKVAETEAKEVPAITVQDAKDSLSFEFATPTAGLYYKIAIEITNTTTYNGVFIIEKITFSN